MPACVKLLDDGAAYECYNISGAEAQTIPCYWAIANDTQAVLVNVNITFVASTLAGDVNRDGSVTIADVTALVDIILGKDSEEPYAYDHMAADVNGDGSITIADVTALVDVILGK